MTRQEFEILVQSLEHYQVAQQAPLPDGTYIVLLNNTNSKLRRKMEAVPGASVLQVV